MSQSEQDYFCFFCGEKTFNSRSLSGKPICYNCMEEYDEQ